MAITRITKGVINPNENYDTHNINSTGIITAVSFVGDASGLTGVASTDNIITGTAATFNTYPVDINAGMTVAGVATFAGNVSIAGTLTYEDVTNIDSVGLITARDGIFLPDTKKAQFGNTAADPDLEIYHGGTASYISHSGTGNLFIHSNTVAIRKQNQQAYFVGVNGQSKLYEGGSERLVTTDKGITVGTGVTIETNGQAEVVGITTFYKDVHIKSGTNRLYLGTSDQLSLIADPSHSYLRNAGSGSHFQIHSNNFSVRSYDGNGSITLFYSPLNDGNEGGGPRLYHNHGAGLTLERLRTTKSGVNIVGTTTTTQLAVTGVSTFTGTLNANQLNFGDSNGSSTNIALFGDGNDLKIYHNGNHSILQETGGGGLLVLGSFVEIGSSSGSEKYFRAVENGAAELYHNNAKKIETTSTGIKVAGDIRVGNSSALSIKNDNASETLAAFNNDGSVQLFYDNSQKLGTAGWGVQINGILKVLDSTDSSGATNNLTIGTGSDLKLYHDGSQSYLKDYSNQLNITADNAIKFTTTSGSETYAKFIHNGAVELYHDNAKTLETTSSGVDITNVVQIGTSNDTGELRIGHDGSSYRARLVSNSSNSLEIDADGPERILMHGGVIYMKPLNTETSAAFVANGAVELYHDNAKTFETYANGIKVTDGDTDVHLELVSSSGTNGYLYGIDGTKIILQTSSNEYAVECIKDGAVNLYHDGSKKFETSSSGITVNGAALVGGNIEINQDAYLKIGASNDLNFTHTGTDSYIQNVTGDLYIQNVGTNSDDIFIDAKDDISIRVQSTENAIKCIGDGAVELYNDNVIKFATSGIGATIYSNSADLHLHSSTASSTGQGQITFRNVDGNGQPRDVVRIIGATGGSTGGYGELRLQTAFNNTLNTRLTIDKEGKSTFTGNIDVVSTDAGSSAAPELKLYRNSASPADADYLGQIKFAGESDTGVERNYAKITGKILDASNGTEDGIIEFAHIKAGSQNISARFRSDSLQLLNDTNFSVNGTTTFENDVTFEVASGNGIKHDRSANQFKINSGTHIRFQNGNESNTDDGKIGPALFASGLNIVGSQTGSGLGRQIRLYGDLLTNNIKPTADSTHSIGTSSNRFANIYADTLYGDGSNLTGISGVTINNNADNRIITGSGTAATLNGEAGFTFDGSGMQLSTANPFIHLKDTTNNTDAYIQTDNAGSIFLKADDNNESGASKIVFQVDGTERLRIFSDGKFGFGTSSLSETTMAEFSSSVGGGAIGANITIRNSSTNSVNNVAELRLKTDHGVARFYKYNTGSTVIQSHSSGASDLLLYADGASNLRLHTNGSERMRINSSGKVGINMTNPDDTLDVNGTAQVHANTYIGGNLYMYGNSYSTGIYMGGSGSSNYINDYEENTWTPVLKDTSGNTYSGGGTITGHYVKVGEMVIVQFSATSLGNSGMNTGQQILVHGIPFAPRETAIAFSQLRYGNNISNVQFGPHVQVDANNTIGAMVKIHDNAGDIKTINWGHMQHSSGYYSFRWTLSYRSY